MSFCCLVSKETNRPCRIVAHFRARSFLFRQWMAKGEYLGRVPRVRWWHFLRWTVVIRHLRRMLKRRWFLSR